MPRETFYDEIDIEDFVWDDKLGLYHYPCPCGDRFEITKSQLRDGDEVARCPSCSLIIRVIYEWDDYEDYETDEEAEGEQPVEQDDKAEAELEKDLKKLNLKGEEQKEVIDAKAGIVGETVDKTGSRKMVVNEETELE